MKSRICAANLFCCLVAIVVGGCGQGHGKADDGHPTEAASSPGGPASAPARNPLSLTAQEQQAAGIQVQAIEPAPAADVAAFTGTLIPNQERIANVVPRLPGRIVTAPVPLGAPVKSGERLAVIESVEVGEAQAAWRQAKSEVTVTEAALDRAQKLAAEDIIAQKDLQRARADAERARATLRAAHDKLRLLGVGIAAADSRTDALYPLNAPISGTLIGKHAVAGAHAGSDPLFTVADLSTVWLEADVYEKDLAALKPGGVAAVNVAAWGERSFPGRLTYVAPLMDPGSRTVKARIEIANPDGALKPGMFARARMPSDSAVPRLVLPAAAVTLMNDRTSVFVLTPQGFKPHPVDVQQRPDGSYEVKGGLQPGEQVAVSGAYGLKSRALKSALAKDND